MRHTLSYEPNVWPLVYPTPPHALASDHASPTHDSGLIKPISPFVEVLSGKAV